MSYICTKCDKKYESYPGLFRHNKNYHPDIFEKKQPNNQCKFCKKVLSDYSCKWRHEKKCKFNNEDMIDKMNKMQEKMHELESQIKNSKKTVNSNNNNHINSNNTNNQNIICVFPLGKEPNNVLSVEFIEKTLKDHGLNSVIELVKKKHFNPELPQYHNFCVTSKNDIYASIVDPETKKIKYVNKKDVFDKVYSGIVSNVDTVKDSKIKETVDKIKKIPISQKMFKKLHIGINEEAYHNKELVKGTWGYANFDVDENERNSFAIATGYAGRIYVDLNVDSDEELEPESKTKNNLINQITNLLNEIKNTTI